MGTLYKLNSKKGIQRGVVYWVTGIILGMAILLIKNFGLVKKLAELMK